MLYTPRTRTTAFTLIELLVVISIIGILISLVYVRFNQSRAITRDKVRQTTLSDMQLAIEQYRAQTGKYPLAGCGATATEWVTNTPGLGATLQMPNHKQCVGTNFITGLVPSYLPAFPNPDRSEGKGFYYRSDGDAYKLVVFRRATSGTGSITSFNDKFAPCPKSNGTPTGLCGESAPGVPAESTSYAVYSVGAEMWE